MGDNVGYVPEDRRYKGDFPEMKAYDSLPSVLRKAISGAAYAYSAAQLLEHWHSYRAEFAELPESHLVRIFAKSYKRAYGKERLAATPFAISMAGYKEIGGY